MRMSSAGVPYLVILLYEHQGNEVSTFVAYTVGFRVSCLGFRVQGCGFRTYGVGFGVPGSRVLGRSPSMNQKALVYEGVHYENGNCTLGKKEAASS